MTEDNASVV